MSLDTVMLVVEIEDYFDISISNSDAEKICTVRDFSNCVYDKYLVPKASHICRSQVFFYKLRSYFEAMYRVDKESFTPKTILSEVFPLKRRGLMWERLKMDFNVQLPELTKSDITGVRTKGLKFFGINIIHDDKPLTDNTVRDFVGWALALNHQKFYDPKNICSREEVEMIIRGLVSEKLSIPVEEIKPNSSFTTDLGID